MKKIIGGLLAVIVSFVFVSSVYASDMSNKLNVSNALGDAVKFDISYDASNDVTNVLTTVAINDDSLETILSQKPGVGGKLGSFYVGVVPQTFIGMSQHKQVNYYYAKNANFQTEVKPDLATKIAAKAIDNSGDPSTWVFGVLAQYYDTTTSSWEKATGDGTGTISIGQNLVDTLGLSSVDELVYGENYRLFMYENYDWYIEYLDVANPSNVEYVKVSYKLKFPVAANNGTVVFYYPNLKQALASGVKNITINSDMTLTEDLTIPSDVSINVADGYKLVVPEGIKLNNTGSLTGTVIDNNKVVTTTVTTTTQALEKNPNTSDNTGLYFVLALVGLGFAGVTVRSLIKHH